MACNKLSTRLPLTLIGSVGFLIACVIGCSSRPAPTPTGDTTTPNSTAPNSGVRPTNPKTRRFAVLVGVDRYDSAEFGDLLYPAKDVTELASVLRTGGYDDANVTVMVVGAGVGDPRYPTAGNIKARLDQVLRACKPDDLLLVAFTGHGVVLEGESHFCPRGADLKDTATLVNLEDVQRQMADSVAGTKVLLSDTSRVSGAMAPVGRPQPGPADLPSVTARKDTTMVVFSFFAHLIGGLEGKADVNGAGQVTYAALTGYVQKKVAETRGDRAQMPHFRADVVASAQPLVVRNPAKGWKQAD